MSNQVLSFSAPADIATSPHERPEHSVITLRGLRLAAGNVGVALLFFSALMPNAVHFGDGLANQIWLFGAIVMGLLSLVRIPASRVSVSLSSVAATGGALIMPAFIRMGPLHGAPSGVIAIAFEVAGIVISQLARIYMGRSFGLLPANRGIVSRGPFRYVRHPVYVGWMLLSIGFALAYPSPRNIVCVLMTLPFIAWRIALEERLLCEDPAYREYCARVRFRLIPGLV